MPMSLFHRGSPLAADFESRPVIRHRVENKVVGRRHGFQAPLDQPLWRLPARLVQDLGQVTTKIRWVANTFPVEPLLPCW